MLSIRRTNGKQGNLLAASLYKETDPSKSRLMNLDSRLLKMNSSWEKFNPEMPSVQNEDDCARLTLDGCPYVSTNPIGFGEVFIASKIRAMIESPARCINLKANGLSESQSSAAAKVLSSNVSILTGGPGTGKTYTLKAISESLESAGFTVAYCAPTGTAAKRMSLSTGRLSTTIHRLLQYRQNQFLRNEDNPLDYDCIVMDEGTMTDNHLFLSLIKAMGDARLILIGDHNQLPPVASGKPFHSLIDIVPTARLTEVRRTDPDGPIGNACRSILEGKLPEKSSKGESGFFLIPMSAHGLTEYLLRCAVRMNPVVNNVGILSPFNHTCDKLNDFFLEHSRMHQIGSYPIMCIRNDYDDEIFNGEVGFSELFPCNFFKFEGRLLDFNVWRDKLAFVRTIHKSQGGEWDDVLIHCPKNNFISRNLSYTAVSRGRRRVAIVGCIESFSDSLSNERCDNRVSMLGELVSGKAKIVQ